MVSSTTWGGLNVGFLGSWSGGAPVGSTGDSDPASDRRPPHAPRDFNVQVVGDFTIKVTWRDNGNPTLGLVGPHPIAVHTWEVRACRANLAGSQTGDPLWKQHVLEKSHSIGSHSSSNRGELISISITDDTLQDSYIQVVGYSVESYTRGQPTEPLLIFADSTLPSGNLNDILEPAIVFSGVTDADGDIYVQLDVRYKSPNDFGRFFGVSLMGTGYRGLVEFQQFGDLLLADPPKPGVLQRNTLLIPSDKDIWHGGYAPAGVVHAVNGSPTVTRVSGSNFVTGTPWQMKSIAIIGSGYVQTISVVGTVNSMTLSANFLGITGDYDAVVLNPMIFYFISVDRSGSRRTDLALAPSIARDAGMFFL